MTLLEWAQQGLLGLGGWTKFAILFAMIQISMMAVTLYLHRDQAHRAIDLHPALRHFFRLLLCAGLGYVVFVKDSASLL